MDKKEIKEVPHTDEWQKWSDIYKLKAKVNKNSDIFFYRHRCIEGLLAGTTNDYKNL